MNGPDLRDLAGRMLLVFAVAGAALLLTLLTWLAMEIG